MYHPKQRQLDTRLKKMFDTIDHDLEEEYGGTYALHPARPQRGQTANPAADGLFNIGVSFSPGYGSTYGRGYVVEVHIATLENVPLAARQHIEDRAASLIRNYLPRFFPDRELRLERENHAFKIIGDFSLGHT